MTTESCLGALRRKMTSQDRFCYIPVPMHSPLAQLYNVSPSPMNPWSLSSVPMNPSQINNPAPTPTPTNPVSMPTNPFPVPTNPVSMPTNPFPVPTNPSQKEEENKENDQLKKLYGSLLQRVENNEARIKENNGMIEFNEVLREHDCARITDLERHNSKRCILIGGPKLNELKDSKKSAMEIYKQAIKEVYQIEIKDEEIADCHYTSEVKRNIIAAFIYRGDGSNYKKLLEVKKKPELNCHTRMSNFDLELVDQIKSLVKLNLISKYDTSSNGKMKIFLLDGSVREIRTPEDLMRNLSTDQRIEYRNALVAHRKKKSGRRSRFSPLN